MINMESVLFIHDTRNGRSLISARIQLKGLPMDFMQASIQMNYIVSHVEELGYRVPLVRRLEMKLEDLIRKIEESESED
jgi:hypothetical protein|tara:strand:- start:286 stop:522 length:237 start_codon:yes stop_codon:yes gene_type:complete